MIEPLHTRLRRLRTQAGWSIKDTAARVGYDYDSVRCWELGKHHPSASSLRDVADLFGVSIQYLLNGAEPVPELPPDVDAKIMGERLAGLRKAHGLSIQAVAHRLGMTYQGVHNWERGDNFTPAWRLPAIARLYQCSLEYLLTGRESPHIATLHRAIRVGASQQQLLSMLPPS